MNIICNLPADFSKNITKIWIFPAPQPNCYLANLFNLTAIGYIIEGLPNEKITEILTLPDDVSIDSKQELTDAGTHWQHNISISVVPNNLQNLNYLRKFTDKKVLALLFTSEETYLVGYNEQPLRCMIEENTDNFIIKLSGETYFSALRNY